MSVVLAFDGLVETPPGHIMEKAVEVACPSHRLGGAAIWAAIGYEEHRPAAMAWTGTRCKRAWRGRGVPGPSREEAAGRKGRRGGVRRRRLPPGGTPATRLMDQVRNARPRRPPEQQPLPS